MQNTLLDLAILVLLVSLFGPVNHLAYDRRLRSWLIGWIAVFLDLLAHAWTNLSPWHVLVRTNLHIDLLALAGVCFLFSFLPRTQVRRVVLLGGRVMVPGAILIFLVLAYPNAVWPLRLVIVVGTLIASFEAHRVLARSDRVLRSVTEALPPLFAVLMLLCTPGWTELLPYILLTEIFLLNAMTFAIVFTPRTTRGVIASTLGLFLWAVSFPVRAFVELHAPSWATSPVLADLWDIPMLFAAFGMILIMREENLAQAAARNEDYRQMFDCHPLPMFIYSTETLRFLHVNQAAVHHYGYTAEEFAAMTILDIRPAEDIPRLRRIIESEHRALNQTHGWHHLLKNGRMIDVDIHRHSMEFRGQRANIVVALDVTQRNAAEQRLRQTFKLESIGHLTSGVAHDFNNLLTVLTTTLEIVAQQDLKGEVRTLILDAMRSLENGVGLTRRLLAYARQEPVDARAVNVRALLDSMLAFLQSSIGPAITLTVSSSPDIWQASIDANQLENCILNLAINARDAMPQGGMLTIHACNQRVEGNRAGKLREVNAGEYVLITIKDTGSGMPEHVLSRATEPFFTTKPKGEGTGLGLSMVSSFLRQFGGSLQIESELNVGTTISLYLPRAIPSNEKAALSESVELNSMPRGTGTILLVEDEPTIRHVVGLLLRSLGYTVLEASDASAALVQLNSAMEIALLLTDVNLPAGLQANELADRARAVFPSLRVIFSSGYTREELLREGRIPDDAHLITKPYHIRDLAQQIDRSLNMEAGVLPDGIAAS